MTRSVFTNQLIKSFLENGSNYLVIHDGEETHVCHTFTEATEWFDAVDVLWMTPVNKHTAHKYGTLLFVMENKGVEQLSDYTDTPYISKRVGIFTERYEDVLATVTGGA